MSRKLNKMMEEVAVGYVGERRIKGEMQGFWPSLCMCERGCVDPDVGGCGRSGSARRSADWKSERLARGPASHHFSKGCCCAPER